MVRLSREIPNRHSSGRFGTAAREIRPDRTPCGRQPWALTVPSPFQAQGMSCQRSDAGLTGDMYFSYRPVYSGKINVNRNLISATGIQTPSAHALSGSDLLPPNRQLVNRPHSGQDISPMALPARKTFERMASQNCLLSGSSQAGEMEHRPIRMTPISKKGWSLEPGKPPTKW